MMDDAIAKQAEQKKIDEINKRTDVDEKIKALTKTDLPPQKEVEETEEQRFAAAAKARERQPSMMFTQRSIKDEIKIFKAVEKKIEEEKPIVEEKHEEPEPRSPISAGGMYEDGADVPSFDDNENASPRKTKHGVEMDQQFEVQVENAADKLRTGTFKPLQTPKGHIGGFQMPIDAGASRQRTGTTRQKNDMDDGETEMDRVQDGFSQEQEDDGETEMERNPDGGSMMDQSDATSFQRVPDGSSMISGGTQMQRMGDGASTMNDGESTMMREVSDWDGESQMTDMQRVDDAASLVSGQ